MNGNLQFEKYSKIGKNPSLVNDFKLSPQRIRSGQTEYSLKHLSTSCINATLLKVNYHINDRRHQ